MLRAKLGYDKLMSSVHILQSLRLYDAPISGVLSRSIPSSAQKSLVVRASKRRLAMRIRGNSAPPDAFRTSKLAESDTSKKPRQISKTELVCRDSDKP